MRGTILGVHDGRGVLLGANDQRLEFPLSEWRSPGTPTPGQVVDYVEADGAARGVFLVPGAAMGGATRPHSMSVILGAISIGCLALGFVIPFVPTVVALVLGCLGASRAREDGDESGLILSRIGWIGALVMLMLGVMLILGVLALVGAAGFASMHGHWSWW
jgi:hypothetical protein